MRRLQTVTVVARELPLVLPAEGATGPVGFVTARADLVYRDPADGSLVVADFKTDRVAQEADVEARIGVYRAQLELYARGIQEALELQTPPRAELWFLSLDRIVQL